MNVESRMTYMTQWSYPRKLWNLPSPPQPTPVCPMRRRQHGRKKEGGEEEMETDPLARRQKWAERLSGHLKVVDTGFSMWSLRFKPSALWRDSWMRLPWNRLSSVSSVFSSNHLVQGWLSYYSDLTMDWPDEELWLNS